MKAAVTVKENYVFRRIYRKGKSSVQPCMVVYCQKNKQGRTRLGVTVSTKLGKAVVRNRVRRQLREIRRSIHLGLLCTTNRSTPPSRLTPCHLPLHRGGKHVRSFSHTICLISS